MADDTRHTFSTGAQRSELMPRYDLLPRTFLERTAGRFELGLKYTEHNYKQGLPFDDTFNHIVDHLWAYRERRKMILQAAAELKQPIDSGQLAELMTASETDGDDLAAAAWGIAAIMELERTDRLG
jgi:hypothetical protein